MFVSWFLMRSVVIRKFKLALKWFGIWYEDVWGGLGVLFSMN